MAEDQAENLLKNKEHISIREALPSSERAVPSKRFLPSSKSQLPVDHDGPSPPQGFEHPSTNARFQQSSVLRSSLQPDLQKPKRAWETATQDEGAELTESSSRGPKRQRTEDPSRLPSRWNSPTPALTENRSRITQSYRQQSQFFLPASPSPSHHHVYQIRHEQPHAVGIHQLSSAVTSGGNPTVQPHTVRSPVPLPVPVLENQSHSHLARPSIGKEYKLEIDHALTAQMNDNFHYYKPLRPWGINREFSYNEYGVLHEKILFDHESLKRFLLEHPLKNKLTIRIQKNPSFTNCTGSQRMAILHQRLEKEPSIKDGKVPDDKKVQWVHSKVLSMSEYCRFAACASKNNLIKTSDPKVCFDEESGRGNANFTPRHNPYRAAGYMHVGCFEKAIRLSQVARYFDIQVDQLGGGSGKSKKKKDSEDRSTDDNPDEDVKSAPKKSSAPTDEALRSSKLLKLDTHIGYRVDRWLWYAEIHPNWDPVSLLETLEFLLRCAKFFRRRSRLKEKMYKNHINPPEPVNFLMHSMSCMDHAGEDTGCLRWDKFADKSTKKDVDSMRTLEVIKAQENFIAVYAENLRILKEEYIQAVDNCEARYRGMEVRLQDMSEAVSKLMVDQICAKYKQKETKRVERGGKMIKETKVVGIRAVLLALKKFYDHTTIVLPGYEYTPTAPKRKSTGAKNQTKQEKKGKGRQTRGFLDTANGGNSEIREPKNDEAWTILKDLGLKDMLYTPRIYWEAGNLKNNENWGGARTVGGHVEKTRESPPKLPLKGPFSDKDWEPVDLEEYGDYFSIFPAVLRDFEDKEDLDNAELPSKLDIKYLYDHIPVNPDGARIQYRVETNELNLKYPVPLDPELREMKREKLLDIARLPRGLQPLHTNVSRKIASDASMISQSNLSILNDYNYSMNTVDPKMMSTDSPMSTVPDLIDDDGSDFDDDEEPPVPSWESTIDPALQDHVPSCQAARGPPDYVQELARNEYYPRHVDEDYNESPSALPGTPASGHVFGREEEGLSINQLKETSVYGTTFTQSYDHEDHHGDGHDPQDHHDGGESLFNQEMGLLNERD